MRIIEQVMRAATPALAFATLWATSPVSAIEIADVFRSVLACTLIEPRLADTRAAALFRDTSDGCTAELPDRQSASDDWYLDADCSLPVAVRHTSLPAWCDSLLEPGTLGEGDGPGVASAGAGGAAAWTLSPGSRLDLGARSLAGRVQPWLFSETFRRVRTPAGTCELQMRVHAPSPVVAGRAADRVERGVEGRVADPGAATNAAFEPPAAANGLALIAWHGGSWSNRAFGTLGLELTVPHFVARGFTVYAPFYRLLGDSPDGSAACRQADFERDVVADAHAAFDWVRDNGERFGTGGAPILFGQSAGGQLAARVAIDRPDEVAGAVLFYAPVDFEDFAQRARDGDYADEQGLDILQRVLGVPASQADLSAAPIAANALPRRIVRDGIAAPPIFLLHGESDRLVELRQSERLCNALAVRQLDTDDAGASSIDPLRRVSLCGDASSLHRLRQGRHALDLCPLAGPVPLDSCPSGSEASRERVADSIGSAAVFAETAAVAAARQAAGEPAENPLQEGEPPIGTAPADQGGTASDGRGGGGATGPLLLLPLLACAALSGSGRQCRGSRLRRASFSPAGRR